MTLARQFREHGERMPEDSLYRVLLLAFADDLERGGVVAEICAGWLDAPASAVVQLRLLGALQRLVLSRQAGELAMYYPNLGGTASPSSAWAYVEPVLRRFSAELTDALALAPQTNEPGRSAALLVGLFDAVRRSGLSRVRLLELGASAGLNLLVDRYLVSGPGWTAGPLSSPLQLPDAVIGPVAPVDFELVERRGCDLSPVDAGTVDGRLLLTSFVWPHHLARHERLRAALSVASSHPVVVDVAPAAAWLRPVLDSPASDGVLTVVWHSITRQYWPASEIAGVAAALTSARARLPLAHIAMEAPEAAFRSSGPGYLPAELTVQLSVPGGVGDASPRVLAIVNDHGIPVRMR